MFVGVLLIEVFVVVDVCFDKNVVDLLGVMCEVVGVVVSCCCRMLHMLKSEVSIVGEKDCNV